METITAELNHQEVNVLREWQRRLSLLLDFGNRISSETNFDRLLSLIVDETKEILQCDRCTVYVLDRETNELWAKVAHGLAGQVIRFPSHLGLAGYVATTGELVNLEDAYNDSRFNQEVDKKTGYHTRTMLTMPMRNRLNEVIGVFQVLNKNIGVFTQQDIEILNILASQAAVAIENAQLYEEQRLSFESFIETLAATIDARDPMTAGHSYRVTHYAVAIGKQLNLLADELEVLRYAGFMHDLGKIGVREAVLSKPGRLEPEERKNIEEHVVYTQRILEKIHFQKKFRSIPQVASSHHEKIDGTGYPNRSSNGQIPRLSMIIAVADVFDALTYKRHYRDPMAIEQVLKILNEGIGKHFHPDCVAAFKQLPLNGILEIMFTAEKDKLKKDDLSLLSAYKVVELEKFCTQQNLTEDEQRAFTLFDLYFSRRFLNSPKEPLSPTCGTTG